MKKITKRTLMMPLLILTLAWFIGFGASDALGVGFGGHEINFLGATYDPGADATTFTYRVTAASTPDTLVKILFWILELDPECFGAGDIIDASESYEYVGPDPATGVYGIKFDQPYAPGESRTVSFRLPGDLSTNVVQIVVRTGCSYWRKEIPGPKCGGAPTPPVPPQCDVTPDLAVCVGSDATFTDNTTAGTPPYTYCWQKEPYTDPCISTTDQLSISGATLDDAGTYRMIVTDALGYADTCYAEFMVYPAPECDVMPDRDSVCVGSDVTFTDNTTGGTPPYTYCWQKEPYTDPCISTTDQLTIFGATLDDAGTYRMIVTDALGYADTCYAEFMVYPAPECDVMPDRDSVCVGSDVTFTDNTTGGTPPYTYCWQKEPYTDPCISSTDQLTISDVTFADEGTYRVIVTDALDCADTCYAQLIVDECPPAGEGKSPGYWKTQLAKYLGYKKGKLLEPNVESYAAQYGYTAEEAHSILDYGGTDMVIKLHRQVVAAKLSTAAGYLSGVDQLLEEGQYMVAHPEEFTEQELEDAKDLFESLHD